jgi:hypothetical protein
LQAVPTVTLLVTQRLATHWATTQVEAEEIAQSLSVLHVHVLISDVHAPFMQLSPDVHALPSSHGVDAAAKLSTGHRMLAPVHVSATSHSPTAARHTNELGRKRHALSQQAGNAPPIRSHCSPLSMIPLPHTAGLVSLMTHARCSASNRCLGKSQVRQIGSDPLFVGHEVPTPSHVSAGSHCALVLAWHTMPLARGVATHEPSLPHWPRLQMPSRCEQFLGTPMHTPASLHMSLSVQGMLSLQTVPTLLGVATQRPPVHTLFEHCVDVQLASDVHSQLLISAMHVPLMQMSLVVHAIPSLQGVLVGAMALAGQAVLAPVQRSATSHWLAALRHTTVLGWNWHVESQQAGKTPATLSHCSPLSRTPLPHSGTYETLATQVR